MIERRPIPHSLKIAIAEKCDFTCQGCGETGKFFPDSGCVLGQEQKPVNWDCTLYRRISMEFDHILPLSKGGKTELDNLQLLCRKCNRGKGDRVNA